MNRKFVKGMSLNIGEAFKMFWWWDFPGGPVVKDPPCSAGDAGSVPGWRTKMPHTAEQVSPPAMTRGSALQSKILHGAAEIPHVTTGMRVSQTNVFNAMVAKEHFGCKRWLIKGIPDSQSCLSPCLLLSGVCCYYLVAKSCLPLLRPHGL